MRELSWFYLYGVGGAIYALGCYACIRAGALDLQDRGERSVFVYATLSLALFALAHGLFQFVFPYVVD